MSNLNKSKRFDCIDKYNDTSRYFDDIYTQTKVKQRHIFSDTLFWKLQNGISG